MARGAAFRASRRKSLTSQEILRYPDSREKSRRGWESADIWYFINFQKNNKNILTKVRLRFIIILHKEIRPPHGTGTVIPGLKEEAAVAQSRLAVAFLGDWKKIQRNHQIIK